LTIFIDSAVTGKQLAKVSVHCDDSTRYDSTRALQPKLKKALKSVDSGMTHDSIKFKLLLDGEELSEGKSIKENGIKDQDHILAVIVQEEEEEE